MKLVSFVEPGAGPGARLGRLTDDGVVPIAASAADLPALLASEGLPGPAAREAAIDLASVRLRAPIPRPGKIVCVGLNYADHCREQGIGAPDYPMLFAKFANAVANPGDAIVRPRATERLDLECELGVVIGQRTSRVTRREALDAVFGYTIVNDVTMRDLQREDRQWLRAKGADGFAPIGPLIVTRDELGDGSGVRMRSSVNGETWQDSTTDEMVFDVSTLIAFISRTITLEPGDIIATGTPAGVGHFQDPPRYLQGGDEMRCEIEGIGVLENSVVDELPRARDHAAASGVEELDEPMGAVQ